MVSVVHSVAAQSDFEHSLKTLCEGLSDVEKEKVRLAAEFAQSVYGDLKLGSGEGVWHHALGMALILVGLRLDVDCRLAALLFAVPSYNEHGITHIDQRFGAAVSHLVGGVSRLNRMRPITRGFAVHADENGASDPAEMKAQVEILRKMFLAVVEDIRVVLLRLALCT